MEKILVAQLIGHIIADFFAQPESLSCRKQQRCLRSWHMYIHILIVFVASLAMTFTISFILYAVAIAIGHFVIDILKCIIERWLKKRKGNGDEFYTNHYTFFADQLLHLAVLYVAVAIFRMNNHSMPAWPDIFTLHRLLILAGLLLCLKPANVAIRICLSSLNLYAVGDNKIELERAGRWIGAIERIMTFTLVMLQQYTAIGFIIAAKSILRYNDSKTGKTEYVLIGTLLSFGFAQLLGIGIREGFFEFLLQLIFCY